MTKFLTFETTKPSNIWCFEKKRLSAVSKDFWAPLCCKNVTDLNQKQINLKNYKPKQNFKGHSDVHYKKLR